MLYLYYSFTSIIERRPTIQWMAGNEFVRLSIVKHERSGGFFRTHLCASKKMMDGKMWVESQGHITGDFPDEWEVSTQPTDSGSIFAFTINTQVENILPTIAPVVPPSLKDKTVLIVDDNETNRQVLIIQCQKLGLKPIVTASGKEALLLLKNEQKLTRLFTIRTTSHCQRLILKKTSYELSLFYYLLLLHISNYH